MAGLLPANDKGAETGQRKGQRLHKRIDTAVQQIYNAKWLYPAAPPNATYSFNSAFAPHRALPTRFAGHLHAPARSAPNANHSVNSVSAPHSAPLCAAHAPRAGLCTLGAHANASRPGGASTQVTRPPATRSRSGTRRARSARCTRSRSGTKSCAAPRDSISPRTWCATEATWRR
jgi:hypothetical protein